MYVPDVWKKDNKTVAKCKELVAVISFEVAGGNSGLLWLLFHWQFFEVCELCNESHLGHSKLDYFFAFKIFLRYNSWYLVRLYIYVILI